MITQANFLKDQYFEHWRRLIDHLENCIIKGNGFPDPSPGLLLACCYIEGLGKLLLYNANSKCPTTKYIFINTLKNVSSESEDFIELIYRNFRCDFVHTGPTNKSVTSPITNQTIDIHWFKRNLDKLYGKVLQQYKNRKFEEIIIALTWGS